MNPVWKLFFFLFNIEGYGEFFSGITPCNDVFLSFECPENWLEIIIGSVSSYKRFIRIVLRLIVQTFLYYQNPQGLYVRPKKKIKKNTI